MDGDLLAALCCLGGYLLGSIPFGLLLTKLAGLGDIRGIGSGNIGATNVLRTGRKGLAAATLILDGLKGVAAVLLARALTPTDIVMFAGLAAVLGRRGGTAVRPARPGPGASRERRSSASRRRPGRRRAARG